MKPFRLGIILATALLLNACGTRTVSWTTSANNAPAVNTPKNPQMVVLKQGDIASRPYYTLGDIEVSVSKWSIFDNDPTREEVAQKLKEKAADMGADAVILVRFGSVGISVLSWGEMEGRGRAIVFK